MAMPAAANRLEQQAETIAKQWTILVNLAAQAQSQLELTIIKEKQTRPEPSRLEIAAMLKAGWFANRDADFNATDHKWWIDQADALIAAAKEKK